MITESTTQGRFVHSSEYLVGSQYRQRRLLCHHAQQRQDANTQDGTARNGGMVGQHD